MNSAFDAPLSDEQKTLLRTIYIPFSENGKWPIWQYVERILAKKGIDANTVYSSFPVVYGNPGHSWQHSYGITFRDDNNHQPRPDSKTCLTVAGISILGIDLSLCNLFLNLIQLLVNRYQNIEPTPYEVVNEVVTRDEILQAIINPIINAMLEEHSILRSKQLYSILEHEPILSSMVRSLNSNGDEWEIPVSSEIIRFKDIVTVDDYIDLIVDWLKPSNAPAVAMSIGRLDLPYAIGYLDAVWRCWCDKNLFARPDISSSARLTQPCENVEEFNSFMSALADILGQVLTPDKEEPEQKGALESLQNYLEDNFKENREILTRLIDQLTILIDLRHLRVSLQHSDARHKAPESSRRLGIDYPPSNWNELWKQVVTLAQGAFDAIREEINSDYKLEIRRIT